MLLAIVFLAAATPVPGPPPPPGTFDKCYRAASVKTAAKPVMSKSLRAKYPDGASVKLAVQIDASGQAVSANTYGTYGDPDLVNAAVAAAQKSTYIPAMYGCKPIENTILVTEEFPGSSP